MQRQVKRSCRHKGPFIMSVNDVPEIRSIFKRFATDEVETNYSIAAKAGGRPKLIIASKAAMGAIAPPWTTAVRTKRYFAAAAPMAAFEKSHLEPRNRSQSSNSADLTA